MCTTTAAATKTVAATTTKLRKDDPTSVLTDNSDIKEINVGSFNSDAKNETAQDELTRLLKEWSSPIYAFFEPIPQIIEIDGRRAHDFKCT
ncbi:hypothetical protein OG21DRAFT_1491739 [Imleria badia]|nr:hypothetical protein OG21DRAFT_1491739 [Imleria badia]